MTLGARRSRALPEPVIAPLSLAFRPTVQLKVETGQRAVTGSGPPPDLLHGTAKFTESCNGPLTIFVHSEVEPATGTGPASSCSVSIDVGTV
jgi:hypothetical protein